MDQGSTGTSRNACMYYTHTSTRHVFPINSYTNTSIRVTRMYCSVLVQYYSARSSSFAALCFTIHCPAACSCSSKLFTSKRVQPLPLLSCMHLHKKLCDGPENNGKTYDRPPAPAAATIETYQKLQSCVVCVVVGLGQPACSVTVKIRNIPIPPLFHLFPGSEQRGEGYGSMYYRN